MLDCDWCKKIFAITKLWNVEYKNKFGNVLCDTCVVESSEFDDFVEAWR